MIKGDSLPEQLYSFAKKGLFTNHQERELVKSAARRIQTLQAERAMAREPAAPKQPGTADDPWWRCGSCGGTIETEQFKFCPWCGKGVKWE